MASPTRIALVIPGFQSSAEDWCIPVFTNLAREIARRVELHVFALRYPNRRDRYMVGDVHVHSLGSGTLAGRRFLGVSLLKLWRDSLLALQSEHARAPFKAVAGIWATESGWLATRAARSVKVPSLVHLAGGELTYVSQIGYGNGRRNLAGRLVAGTLATATLLTVPSGPMRRALMRRVDAGKVRDWAPGVDTNMFTPWPERRAQRPFTFVTVGSLIPVKGHDLLLHALAGFRSQLPDRQVRLRVVGDGPLRPSLEKLARDLNLTGYVAFEGDVAHEMLPAIYKGADAFLLGAWHESQCMAALEAMACGLPWVGPPVGALADLPHFSKGKPTGIAFTTRDPQRVAEAMKSLVELSQPERCEYGMAARRVIEQHYEMARQAGGFLQLIDQLTER